MSGKDTITQIYEKLNELFGNKAGQLFVMEYPGRILDIGNYAYEGSDSANAQGIKPQSIVEAEFRLSDDLFNLGELTGGPNGSKLSVVYEEILNSLIPNGAENDSYESQILPDQDLIAAWLIEDVPNWFPPPVDILSALLPEDAHKHIENPKKEAAPVPVVDKATGKTIMANPGPEKIPRIDLYQKLLDAYEEENFRWKQFMLNARPKDDKDAKAWDFYNRTIAIYGPVVEKKLEALWTTLIVRGQYHRVRHFIGLVDVESSSGALLAAKSSLRESMMRSVDQTQNIYPVQFSPASWANFLTTDFEPIDLLMDPKALRERLVRLQGQRRSVVSQKTLLESGQLSRDALDRLEEAKNTARSNYDTAAGEMIKGFSDMTLKLAQMFFNSLEKKQDAKDPAKKADLKQSFNKFQTDNSPSAVEPVDDNAFDKLAEWQFKSVDLTNKLTSSAEAYTRAMAQNSAAKASDASLAISQLQKRIDGLTQAIEELMTVLGSAGQGQNITGQHDPSQAEDKAGTVADGKALPPAQVKKGASLWQTIEVHGKQSSAEASTSLSSSASASQVGANFLFGGYKKSTSSSSAESKKESKSYEVDTHIAFSVMKVTINRPWFNASILQNTKGFFHITAGKKISANAGWAKNNSNTPKEEKKKAFDAAQDASVLPAFPIAFLIVKDVSISITDSSSKEGSSGKEISNAVSEAGGFLCFSCSKSSSDESSTHSAYSSSNNQHTVIRIPGPQVLGWFMQSVAEDETNKDYKRFDPSTLPGHGTKAAK